MALSKLILPVVKCDADDAGVVAATTAAAGTTNLAPGLYKIAAMGSPLLWRTGATPVTNATGSYLAAGDQELIRIPGTPATDTVDLTYILSADASGDGQINIVKVYLYDVQTLAPEASEVPAP